jgi:hypothetical protein
VCGMREIFSGGCCISVRRFWGLFLFVANRGIGFSKFQRQREIR